MNQQFIIYTRSRQDWPRSKNKSSTVQKDENIWLLTCNMLTDQSYFGSTQTGLVNNNLSLIRKIKEIDVVLDFDLFLDTN